MANIERDLLSNPNPSLRFIVLVTEFEDGLITLTDSDALAK